MRRLTSLFSSAFLLACLMAGLVSPAAARDLAAIKASGTLVIAIPDIRTPPFFFEENGELLGLDIDLAKSIAQSLGVKPIFNLEAKTFNDAVQLVASGKADISAAKVSRTLTRAQTVLFTEPYIILPHALLINRLRFAEISRGKPVALVMQQFTGSIGVIAKSSFADFARSNFPRATIVEFEKWDQVVDAVAAGKVTAAYRDAFEAKRILKIRPDLAITVRSVVIEDVTDTIGMAVGPNDFHLLAYLNLFLSQKRLKYSTDEILQRYEKFLR